MTQHSNCRSCGAPIIWAETVTGKKIPLDTALEKRFVCTADMGLHTPGDPFKLVNTYQTHFVSCPNAAKHRRKP